MTKQTNFRILVDGTIAARLNNAQDVSDWLMAKSDSICRSAKIQKWSIAHERYQAVSHRWNGAGVVIGG